MKKNFLFIILASILTSPSHSLCQDSVVKLIRSENYNQCGFPGTFDKRDILIQINDLAYEKQVYVHQLMTNGTWIDFPAHYIREGNSTYELWGFDTLLDIPSTFGNQFVIKYIVLGDTFWDNNSGTNYVLSANSTNGPGSMLGRYINVFLKEAKRDQYDGKLYASIDLRNIAYAKTVTLTYTTDNWQTTTTLYANYQSTTRPDFCTYLYWPNEYNIERWTVVSPAAVSGPIQFYISYIVDGQTYYDNNYWSNYLILP